MPGIRKVRVPALSPATVPAEPPVAAGPCPNCGDTSPGKYCPECGQARRTRLVSLREMAVDFLDDQMSLNSRLPHTLFSLLLRPGYLTEEYLRGRIASYIRPLRLYLGASVVFFLLLSFAEGRWLQVGATTDARGAALAAGTDSLVSALRADLGSAGAGLPEADGSWVDRIDVRTPVPALDQLVEQKRAHFRRMTPGEAVRELAKEFQERIPTMMFLLLPVFALLLKVLYARRSRLYVEHFVFALHLHAFAFAAFTVMLLARNGAVSSVLTLWVMLYTFLSMRRVYGQSALKTGVKYMALGWGYTFVLTFALAITGIVTLLMV